jgi:Endoribonuclease L-PSP
MDGKTVVRTENAPAPFQGAPYSQAIKANGLVFVAGQLGFEPGQTEVVGPGIKAQTEQTIDNLEAILTEDREDDGVPRLAERFPGYERGLCRPHRRQAACAVDDRGRRASVRGARRDRRDRARVIVTAMADQAI